MYKTTAKIDGMACGMCEAHANETVRKAFAVEKVTSSHRQGTCTILSRQPIEEQALAAALEPTGYRVVSAQCQPYERKGLFGFGR